jgi:hypothetical protein
MIGERTMYRVENLDHRTTGARNVRCVCGNGTFVTPEPPTDRFFTGRFRCTACAALWSTENIVQRLAFVGVGA